MDIIWFIFKFRSFFIGEKKDPESGLKRIIYLISICGTIIKCLFIYALRNIKKKTSFDDIEKNGNNEYHLLIMI